jgi:hypothetical protein
MERDFAGYAPAGVAYPTGTRVAGRNFKRVEIKKRDLNPRNKKAAVAAVQILTGF